jgi:hypothetical protein
MADRRRNWIARLADTSNTAVIDDPVMPFGSGRRRRPKSRVLKQRRIHPLPHRF